jgi:hypothetical protein
MMSARVAPLWVKATTATAWLLLVLTSSLRGDVQNRLRSQHRVDQAAAAARLLTWTTDGLVSVEPSWKRTVGTVRSPSLI